MASVSLQDLSKQFGTLTALSSVNLEIAEGEFFSLLGPSGCGKTTLLRLIAGLEVPTAGRIVVDGVDITPLPPQKREIGIVFQNYALFPHMTVFDNVAYGLEVRHESPDAIRRRVKSVLAKVRLQEKERTPVTQLSGGEQQRVALARAIVVRPRLLLFDEPLSNLDHELRIKTRGEIKRLQREEGITTIYVTHDQGEALALSDRIAVMNNGVVRQIGSPPDLYLRPSNTFTASFIGHANFFTGEESRLLFGVDNVGKGELLAILPEEFLIEPGDDGTNARIIGIEFFGFGSQVTVAVREKTFTVLVPTSGFGWIASGVAVKVRIPGELRRTVRNDP